MPSADALVDPHPLVVRAAVADDVAHLACTSARLRVGGSGRASGRIDETGDAAHGISSRSHAHRLAICRRSSTGRLAAMATSARGRPRLEIPAAECTGALETRPPTRAIGLRPRAGADRGAGPVPPAAAAGRTPAVEERTNDPSTSAIRDALSDVDRQKSMRASVSNSPTRQVWPSAEASRRPRAPSRRRIRRSRHEVHRGVARDAHRRPTDRARPASRPHRNRLDVERPRSRGSCPNTLTIQNGALPVSRHPDGRASARRGRRPEHASRAPVRSPPERLRSGLRDTARLDPLAGRREQRAPLRPAVDLQRGSRCQWTLHACCPSPSTRSATTSRSPWSASTCRRCSSRRVAVVRRLEVVEPGVGPPASAPWPARRAPSETARRAPTANARRRRACCAAAVERKRSRSAGRWCSSRCPDRSAAARRER